MIPLTSVFRSAWGKEIDRSTEIGWEGVEEDMKEDNYHLQLTLWNKDVQQTSVRNKLWQKMTVLHNVGLSCTIVHGMPERIKFRLCVLAFQCLHGTAPRYLAETLHLTTSRSSCSRLRSADTSTLIVPATR